MSLQFASSEPIVPFDIWLQAKYTGEISPTAGHPEYQLENEENRAAYAEYVVITWEDPKACLLDRFSVGQISKAMATEPHVYMDPKLPRELRNRAWTALQVLFQNLFEPLVSDKLGHRGETDEPDEKLNEILYMWWEVSPFYVGSRDVEPVDESYFLATCGKCLASPKPAIQEAGVHGLGMAHQGVQFLDGAQALLTDFLRQNRAARPELVAYAKRAIAGRIQ